MVLPNFEAGRNTIGRLAERQVVGWRLLRSRVLLSLVAVAVLVASLRLVVHWRASRAFLRKSIYELTGVRSFADGDGTCTKKRLAAENATAATATSATVPKYDVIVGGYRYMEDDRQIPLDENHYIWNLNLPNSTIYWYRRVKAEIEPARMSYPGKVQLLDTPGKPECIESGKMRLEERVLPANRGRDAAALIDHILQIYDDGNSSSFPDYLLFLHGHVAHGYHTSCEAVFARTATQYKYAQKHKANNRRGIMDKQVEIIANHMTTLTSNRGTVRGYKFQMKSLPNRTRVANTNIQALDDSSFPNPVAGFAVSEVDEYSLNNTMTCTDFYDKWNGLVNERDRYTRKQWRSCCASAIIPADRIHRFPKEYWEDLMKVHMRPTDKDKYRGRFCFEHIFYLMLGDDIPESDKGYYDAVLEEFYEEEVTRSITDNRQLQYAIDVCDSARYEKQVKAGWMVLASAAAAMSLYKMTSAWRLRK
ncbi:hypothetical protein THAOC_09210 [Thalassiosira oceanica]|uniref:Uncharacterized protein n=1 Tax=Thalassiosira oceanica TaxID=159749 RepID=K0SX43_THAOC|nr:hypothetical protein THAOC_09210 [Thalassiosira oceanica]|eukprot:EJK69524.1 hypothetical protein THAOC_09210 [Thalassiosira oceanica]